MKREESKQRVFCFKRWSRASYSVFNSLNKQVTISVLRVGMSLLSLHSLEVIASTPDTTSIAKVINAGGVEVVLERQTPIQSAITPTQIFNRQDKANAPLQSLESALRLTPSVDVRERGGKGVQADLSIRGGSFDQTMVTLNGINFTDARTGHQSHSLPIDIEQVASIEVIDGIAGIGAYAGAINFRTAPLSPQYIRAELSGGDYGYGYANLSGAYSSDRLSIFAAGSYRRSDGYIYNTDFENFNAFTRVIYDSPKLGLFDAQAGAQTREFGANGFYSLKWLDQFEATQTYLGSLRWVKSVDAWRFSANASYRKNFDRFELVKGDESLVLFNHHFTDNYGAEATVDYTSILGNTSLGVEYTYNLLWSTNMGDIQEVSNGVYTRSADRSTVNYRLRQMKTWQEFTLSGSAALSVVDGDNHFLWSATGSYRPTSELLFEAGATKASRMPTFTDLYYTATGYISNPDLVAEEAVTYRLNGSYGNSLFSTSALLYLRDGKNTIDWIKEDAESDWQSMQITDLRTLGSEFSASYTPNGFVERLDLSYGYITMNKDSGDDISKYATDYMRHKAALSLTLRLYEDLSLVVIGTHFGREGSYTDASGEILNYTPYQLLDARLNWQRGRYRVYLDATNILSTKYFDYGGLLMPPLWVSGGFSITI